MVLIERVPSEEFEKYRFPKLREVTGYMLFFRVINLTTLRRLFPQLAVIRGQQLIGNYALVFYYMEKMIEVGLKNLIAIQRGFVYSLHCPQLCHLDTIDWAAISGLDNNTKNLNSFEPPKSVCNKSEVCRSCVPKYCWGSESCQKFYNGYNFNGRIKCHPQCIGGCKGTSAMDCNVCRGFKEGKQCVEQCSADKLMYRHTKRCITKETCLNRGGLLFMNECVLECPAGYSATNVDQEEADFSIHKCYPCRHRCPKVCDGTEIMYLSDADRMRGCTIVNGTLHIRLKEDHPNLLEELRNGLGDIEEIMGVLKVFRSNYISSLEFLANLEIIHGQYGNENSNFSLMVYENSNLQRLWNFEQKITLRLMTRSMYFRNNELLCNAHIKLLQKIAEYDNSSDTIDWNSNGYMQACHVQPFHARYEVVSSHVVTVYWSKHNPKPHHHRLQGYLVYYIRTNVNKSPYEGRDLCSKYGWKSRYVSLDNVTIEGSFYAYNLTRLKPFTRYAFYVKAYYNESFNSATDLVGLSDMQYFMTAKDRPTSPLHVRTARKNESTITLTWRILTSEQAMVMQYHVDVFIQPDEMRKFDERNYCLDPHQPPRTAQYGQASPAAVDICSEDSCCSQFLYEKELEEDDDDDEDEDELTQPDDFFSEQNSMENGGRIGGRRKKRSVKRQGSPSPMNFELSMLKLLKQADTAVDHYERRMRRDTDDEIEFVNRVSYQDFTTDNYEHTVTGLQPFTRYVFQLFACSENDTKSCSSYSLYTDRTNPSPHVDRLHVTIETETATNASTVPMTYTDRIVLYIPEPTEVNGLTVAYRVEVQAINGPYLKRRSECFTRLQHETNQYRYTVEHLRPGEYMVRAQVVSLAGPGPFSEWMFVRVLEPLVDNSTYSANTGLRDGLIVAAVLLVIGIGLGLAYLRRERWWRCQRLRRRRGGSKRDDKIPLADNDGNQINLDDGFVNCPLK
ncbi:insulin-like peptide receptor [Anopheles maculipalpis]|uniref:insulin-like peptide receptor n=1 Tax=Anopheles maculipalpis TaxID=1496333 RepID=UPI0021597A9E|nr:insulin-like peptide receptor [Anopheles maculipalpis]